MSKFEIKVNKEGSSLKVNVAGTIDEDVDFSAYPLTGAEKVELSLGKIKSINSCGIREWIKWMGAAGSAKVSYSECPKVIVDQINMVQGFLPAGGKVESFYVPYYNDESGAEKNVLFRYGSEYTDSGLGTLPAIKDDSGQDMEMDVVEAKYFKFLKK